MISSGNSSPQNLGKKKKKREMFMTKHSRYALPCCVGTHTDHGAPRLYSPLELCLVGPSWL